MAAIYVVAHADVRADPYTVARDTITFACAQRVGVLLNITARHVVPIDCDSPPLEQRLAEAVMEARCAPEPV